jgi:hypothetical protein
MCDHWRCFDRGMGPFPSRCWMLVILSSPPRIIKALRSGAMGPWGHGAIGQCDCSSCLLPRNFINFHAVLTILYYLIVRCQPAPIAKPPMINDPSAQRRQVLILTESLLRSWECRMGVGNGLVACCLRRPRIFSQTGPHFRESCSNFTVF